MKVTLRWWPGHASVITLPSCHCAALQRYRREVRKLHWLVSHIRLAERSPWTQSRVMMRTAVCTKFPLALLNTFATPVSIPSTWDVETASLQE
jgi:hypothetical protein